MVEDLAQRPTVLILTPMKSAARYLDGYFAGLQALTYPHELLSLGILEGDSDDDTYAQLQVLMGLACKHFQSKHLFKRDFGKVIPVHLPRHTAVYQSARRAVLARARNHLLFNALRTQDWVLWLDADVIAYPPDIIERLIALGLDIVHPHCVTAYGGDTFDRNAWADHGRTYMQDLRGRERVRLDSVGGTMLLVRADRHRDGLVFPPFFYGAQSRWARIPHPSRGHLVGEIETEGFALMAKDMGIECWGLPDLEILHAPD
ncbi:glycosyltransferase [Bradyrhizobium sp. HKCCYLR20261]|uniref:glycosyltransferase n=1 Tax=Bradyrhizobium sp. HKCCYLR20261 TaxID=3420760 RepID=UPI003EBB81DD